MSSYEIDSRHSVDEGGIEQLGAEVPEVQTLEMTEIERQEQEFDESTVRFDMRSAEKLYPDNPRLLAAFEYAVRLRVQTERNISTIRHLDIEELKKRHELL